MIFMMCIGLCGCILYPLTGLALFNGIGLREWGLRLGFCREFLINLMFIARRSSLINRGVLGSIIVAYRYLMGIEV